MLKSDFYPGLSSGERSCPERIVYAPGFVEIMGAEMLNAEESPIEEALLRRARPEVKGALIHAGELRGRVIDWIGSSIPAPQLSQTLRSKADAVVLSLASGHPDQAVEWLFEVVDLAQAVADAGEFSREQGLDLVEQANTILRHLNE